MFEWKMWAREKFYSNDSKKISNSIFQALYTGSIIISYEIGKFSPNVFLHVRTQNCELVKNCVRMIQIRSEMQYLRLFILLQFKAVKKVCLVATSFCIFICKMRTHEKLCTNV